MLSKQDQDWMLTQALETRMHAVPFLQESKPAEPAEGLDNIV